MFDKNWNIIIVLLIIVLAIAYYCNNYEGFAGSLDAKNAEAIANVASLYNKDNLTVTNLTATGTLKAMGAVNFRGPTQIEGATQIIGGDGLRLKGGNEYRFSPDGDWMRFYNDKGLGPLAVGNLWACSFGDVCGKITNLESRIAALENKTQNINRDSAGNLLINSRIIATEGMRIPYRKQLQFVRPDNTTNNTLWSNPDYGLRLSRTNVDGNETNSIANW